MTRWLAPLGIFALAFALRALHAPEVFLEGRVQLSDPDAYYHMRRVLYTLVNFPASLDLDPYLAPPEGGRAIWPPLFDAVLAWGLRPFWAPGGELAVERAAAWAPPLLGALAAVAVFALGRRLFDSAVGAVAGVLVAILPLHVHYSKVGFVDHHAAVALAAVGLIAAAFWLLRRLAGSHAWAGLAAPVLTLGAALGATLLLWPGGLVHVVAVVATLLWIAATRASRDEAVRVSHAAAAAYGVAFVVVAPSGLAAASGPFGDWTPVVISRFQPWLFAALVGHALACAALWRRLGERMELRLLVSLALGLAVLGASALALPGLAEGVLDARSWLARDETFQAMVAESQPLLHVRGSFSPGVLRRQLGDLGYLLPFFLAWMLLAARRSADRDAVTLLGLWTLLLFAAALSQRRFANSASLPFALVTAWALVEAARRASLRFAGGSRAVTAGLASLALVAGTAAFTPAYAVRTARLAAHLREGPAPRRPPDRFGSMVALGEWLRAGTPPTRGYFDASERPEYTVLAMWGHGHVIRYVGRRAPVVDNFGDDVSPEGFAASLRYFGERDEAAAVALLDRFGVRYVAVDPVNVRIFAGRGPRSLSHRLYRFDGAGLGHHRLVREIPGAAPERPAYKVFERVAGARLVGRARPGATVRARLAFVANAGGPGVLEWAAEADAAGRFELVVPHATSARGDVATALRYEVDSGGAVAEVAVGEDAVSRGLVVTVPPLAPAEEEGP